MANEFYALMGRMRYITRWGLMRNTFSENISEHSHMTAVLAHALALIRRDILNLPAPDPDRCAVAALYHDASEILTGDLPEVHLIVVSAANLNEVNMELTPEVEASIPEVIKVIWGLI